MRPVEKARAQLQALAVQGYGPVWLAAYTGLDDGCIGRLRAGATRTCTTNTAEIVAIAYQRLNGVPATAHGIPQHISHRAQLTAARAGWTLLDDPA